MRIKTVLPKKALLEFLLWLLLGAILFGLTYQFDEVIEEYRFGAAGWPRFLIFCTASVALIQFIREFFKAQGMKSEIEKQKVFEFNILNLFKNIRLICTFILPIVYLFLIPRVGFYIITPFFLSGYMLVLGQRKIFHLLGTTILFYLIILFIFVKLLFVPIPVGVWPGFYEANNFILSHIR
jgi:hypothetical protein